MWNFPLAHQSSLNNGQAQPHRNPAHTAAKQHYSKMKWALVLQLLATVWSIGNAQLDTEETAVEEEHVELFTTPKAKMAAATSDFGYNLFRAMASRATANVFLAPTSISAVLTQLSLGASEQAQRQLFWALRYHNLQDPQLHNTLRDLLTSIKAPGKGLSTAARIYLSRKLQLKQAFLGVVETQYGVRPKALTGTGKDLREINEWVKQQTGRNVANFLAKALPRIVGVNLVGAGYFKGKWVTRFGQSGAMEDFQLDGGATVRVPMMHQDNYPMKMGIDSDLACTPTHVSLKLPAMKVTYSTDLLPVLPDLGLSEWLAQTNLVAITAQAAKVVSVNHKVVMEIAPEGTQYPSSSRTPSHLVFHVNRPFLYLVRDEASGALLFMGRNGSDEMDPIWKMKYFCINACFN
ncbi:Pigment epithelium-derived factor [Merluccius polli]|uniref:Pigment epithelium-derived factor n=1 Tax=Merluccius polli TaxID=89951 RepID=A0AA47M8G6_MERPO|nr:Pigment epithelium-derived factor [Merluccius polli]